MSAADPSDKPSRTVIFDTGMAMTLSCTPLREGVTPLRQAPPAQRQADQQGATAAK